MKSDEITIPNILEIKTISPSSSPRGIKIIFIDQKIIKYKIFAFFILSFLSFFTNSITFNVICKYVNNVNMFNIT